MSEQDTDIEAQAREAGWSPKEEWRGPEEKWVDAKTFVERVDHVLPLLKKDRDKIRAELQETKERMIEQGRAIKEAQESMAAFKEFHEEDTRRRVEAARKELSAQLKAAREAGDTDAEIEVQEAIAKMSAEQAAPKKPIAEARKEAQPQMTPEFIEWARENPWFSVPALGQKGDEDKTQFAFSVSTYAELKGLKGRALLDEVTKLVQANFPDTNSRRSAPAKVEGSRTGASQINGVKHTFSDLTKEEREGIERYAERLVGKNKMYQTRAEFDKSQLRRIFPEDYE